MTDNPKINIEISAMTGEIKDALAKVAESLKQLAEQIMQIAGQTTQQMGKLKGGLDTTKLLNHFQSLARTLGNVKNKLDETVGAALSWSKEVNALSRTLGISTKEAGGLAKALGKLGSDTGSYTGAVFDLQRSLDAQEAAFNANGIATRDAGGEMLGIQQVMMNTLKRVKEMKLGYDANALAMLAFGQSAKDLGGMLDLTGEAIDDGAAKVKELGIEVDAGDTAVQTYQAAMNDVRDTLDALKIKVGQDLMPALVEMSRTFADIASVVAPILAKIFSGLSTVTDHWATALAALVVVLANKLKVAMVELFTTVIPKLIGGVQAFIASLGPIGIAMAVVAAAVVVWDQLAGAAKRAAKAAAEYAKAKAEAFITEGGLLRQYAADMRTLVEQMAKEEAANGRATEAQWAHKDALVAAIRALGNAGSNYAETLYICSAAQIQQLGTIDKMLEAQKKETETKLAAAEAELRSLGKTSEGYAEKTEEVKKLRAEMIALTGDAVKAAGAFVAPGAPKPPKGPKPAATEPTVDADAHVQDWKAAEAEKEEARKAAAEKASQEAEAAAKAAQEKANALALAQLEDERALADHKVAMGQMTAEKRLELERGFIAREYEIRARGAEDAALLDIQLQNKLKDNERKQHEERTKAWRELGDSIKSSMGDAFAGLINGTMSWGDATKKVVNTALQGFINLAAQELLKFSVLESMKTLIKGKETATRTGIAAAGATSEATAEVGAASVGILAKAWDAAAGAFKAMVGIPYVGPALAAGAAAAALGAVMAMTGNLPSAAGGYWDVPRDQLAAIHKNEMVLPAAHSQRLRALIEGGEAGGSGALGSGGSSPVNISINATDAAGVARLFRNNGSALVKAMKAQARNFAFQG